MFSWFKTKKPQVLEKPKTLGQLGEEFAQKHYTNLGYEILAANFFNKKGLRKGEIDFVAKDKKTLVFVEVKTRKSENSKFGSAAEAVNVYKQRKLLTAVKMYLLQHPDLRSFRPTIEVCEVLYNEFDKSFRCGNIISNAVEDVN